MNTPKMRSSTFCNRELTNFNSNMGLFWKFKKNFGSSLALRSVQTKSHLKKCQKEYFGRKHLRKRGALMLS